MHVHQQHRDIRRRHAGYPRRLAQCGGADARELVLGLVSEPVRSPVVEFPGNLHSLCGTMPVDFRGLAANVALVAGKNVQLLHHFWRSRGEPLLGGGREQSQQIRERYLGPAQDLGCRLRFFERRCSQRLQDSVTDIVSSHVGGVQQLR